jgi:hypothetical protein
MAKALRWETQTVELRLAAAIAMDFLPGVPADEKPPDGVGVEEGAPLSLPRRFDNNPNNTTRTTQGSAFRRKNDGVQEMLPSKH